MEVRLPVECQEDIELIPAMRLEAHLLMVGYQTTGVFPIRVEHAAHGYDAIYHFDDSSDAMMFKLKHQ